jgi:hypothetical protein
MKPDTLFLQVGLLVAINVGILATALVSAWRDADRRGPNRVRDRDGGSSARTGRPGNRPANGRRA